MSERWIFTPQPTMLYCTAVHALALDDAANRAYRPANPDHRARVAMANGKTTAQSCKEAEITEQTYYRWRKEYGGLQVDQARRLKELEQENVKLKRLVSELSLEKLVLKDIASGNF
jgi:putative transposase